MPNSKRKIIVILALLLVQLLIQAPLLAADAAVNTVYRQTVNRPIDKVYPQVYKSLEDAHFYVVFEPDIGANLSRFAGKWGEDYNRNKLTAIRSMVFCNGWYANRVSNEDINMLGLCPLHLSLIEKDGRTTVLFNRPTAIAGHSPARELIAQIEEMVIEAIRKGMAGI